MKSELRIPTAFRPLKSDWLEALAPDLSKELEDYLSEAKNRYEHDLIILESLGKSGELLELGSYPYCMTYFLERLGFSVTGLDLKVSRANQLLKKHDIKVHECDLETGRFPCDDRQFDVVVFNEVIEHLRINPLHTLSEIRRCLKDDGLLMLSTPNLYGITMVAHYLVGKGIEDPVSAFRKYEETGHMGHLRTYSRVDIDNMLKASGFMVKGYAARPLFTGSPRKVLRKKLFYKILPQRFHDDHVFVAAKSS